MVEQAHLCTLGSDITDISAAEITRINKITVQAKLGMHNIDPLETMPHAYEFLTREFYFEFNCLSSAEKFWHQKPMFFAWK